MSHADAKSVYFNRKLGCYRWVRYANLVFLFAFGSALFAQEHNLSLTVEGNKGQLLLYEPLPLCIVLHNSENKVVETTLGLNRLGVETSVLTSYENGDYLPWKRGWLPDNEPVPLMREKLDPGQSIKYCFDCLWQKSNSVFEKPGNYRVKARWRGSVGAAGTLAFEYNVSLESDPFLVTVIEGSEMDKACMDFILKQSVQGYLSVESKDLLSELPQEDQLQKIYRLYDVTQKFGKSVYATYALATLLSVIDNDKMDPGLRDRIMEAAKNHIQQDSAHPRVLYFCARSLASKTPEYALALIDKARKLKPDAVVSELIDQLANELKSYSK